MLSIIKFAFRFGIQIKGISFKGNKSPSFLPLIIGKNKRIYFKKISIYKNFQFLFLSEISFQNQLI